VPKAAESETLGRLSKERNPLSSNAIGNAVASRRETSAKGMHRTEVTEAAEGGFLGVVAREFYRLHRGFQARNRAPVCRFFRSGFLPFPHRSHPVRTEATAFTEGPSHQEDFRSLRDLRAMLSPLGLFLAPKPPRSQKDPTTKKISTPL
jgi:hypothetical protein